MEIPNIRVTNLRVIILKLLKIYWSRYHFVQKHQNKDNRAINFFIACDRNCFSINYEPSSCKSGVTSLVTRASIHHLLRFSVTFMSVAGTLDESVEKRVVSNATSECEYDEYSRPY